MKRVHENDFLRQKKGYFNPVVETMPWLARKAQLNRSLTEAIGYAYKNSPTMHKRMANVGVDPQDIKTIEDLFKIPVTRKDELIKIQKECPPFGGFLAVPIERLERIYLSPGPIFDPHQPDAYARCATALYAAGFRENDIVLNTFSYHMTPAGHMFDVGLKILKCPVISSGTGATELQIEILKQTKASGFLGMATFLSQLYEKAEEIGFDPQNVFNLKVALAGGEPGGGPIRSNLEKKYSLIISDVYATADLGPVAHECSAKNGMHVLDNIILEIVDPKSGEPLPEGEIGEIVITPFNLIYPLIRFGTGDLARTLPGECPCGRTAPRISQILGRVGDSIRARGMLVHKNQLMDIVNSFPELKGFKVIVTRLKDRDQIQLKVGVQAPNIDRDRLSKMLISKIKDTCHIRVDQIEFEPAKNFEGNTSTFFDKRAV